MSTKALPPPLPPETRTVGQVVAEAIRLYGRRYRLALPLGLPLAAADAVAVGATTAERIAILVAAAPAFTLAFAWASAIAGEVRPGRPTWLRAVLLGTLAFLPAAVFFPWFAILSVAWLALVGLVVPVVMIENAPPRLAFRRAVELCRADYVHALGSLATLVIVFVLSRVALAFLLREQADNTIRVAVFLADIVVSPLLFLGGALPLLYFDQAGGAHLRSYPLTDHDVKVNVSELAESRREVLLRRRSRPRSTREAIEHGDDQVGFVAPDPIRTRDRPRREPVAGSTQRGLPGERPRDRTRRSTRPRRGRRDHNGAPGIRHEYGENYYGAYVLDPDGNNAEAMHGGEL